MDTIAIIIAAIAVIGMGALAIFFEYGGGQKNDESKSDKED